MLFDDEACEDRWDEGGGEGESESGDDGCVLAADLRVGAFCPKNVSRERCFPENSTQYLDDSLGTSIALAVSVGWSIREPSVPGSSS